MIGYTFGWVLGLILFVHDFFWHFEDCGDNIWATLRILIMEFLRWPPHHFWTGIALFIPFFVLDCLW